MPKTKGGGLGMVLGWVVLGLVFFIAALVMTLPAVHVAGWLKLPLADVRGSVWQGSAQLRLPKFALEKIDWRIGLGAPWSTPLVAKVKVDDASVQAQGVVGLARNGALRVRDLQIDTRLNSPLVAAYLPVPLDGMVRFNAASALWQGGLRHVESAQLDVSELKLLMGEPLLLGSFAAQGAVQNGVLKTSLRDTAGMVQLQGEIQGDAASGVSVQAQAQARPGAPQALVDTLNLLPAAPNGGALLQGRVPAPRLARPK
ncbi:MAG: type II secretion system protein N [Halothiobacillaceae bacterium]